MTRTRTVAIVAPRASGPAGGNRVTALRWAARLRQLGCRVFLSDGWSERACDLLVVLHAEKNLAVIERARASAPDLPVVVACAGTDLYGTGKPTAEVLAAVAAASHVVVLQPRALELLPAEVHGRTSVIWQSVTTAGTPEVAPDPDAFEVCVLAHLRPVKDPLLPARAARGLPDASRIRVRLVGGALDPDLERDARREVRANERFVWEGAVPRPRALYLLRRARLLVSPSRHEGGSNAVSEALALDVPVLATAIPGTLGLLGDGHPGTFPVGDADALRGLLARAETDATFLAELRRAGRERAWITDPALERRAWGALLERLFGPGDERARTR